MFKRISAFIIALLFIVFAFSGCFGKASADKSFAFPITSEPTSLDPQIADSDSEKLIITNCFEGLLRISQSGEIENGVAEKYEVSSDGLCYTFYLRQNAHWALFSGHKDILGENYAETFDINVYAEDFEFAFDRVFDPQINSPYKYLFSSVSSYEATDKYTFQVNLKYSDDNFLYSLTTAGAMPCDEEFYNLTSGKYGLDAKYLLCNGAFNVSKWTSGTSVRIVRNDDYNGVNTVSPSSVTFYINPDGDTVAEKMNSSTYDAAFLSSSEYDLIENKDDFNTQSIENVVYSLIFNQSDKYLSDKNIRLALANAVDLSLVSSQGEYTAATSIVPPFCKIGSESYASAEKSSDFSYNADAAKEYFEQGLLDTGTSGVELEIKCSEKYETLIKQLVQTMQKTLGVKFAVTVTALSQSQLDAAVKDGNFSIVFYPLTADSSLTSDFFEKFASGNIYNYSSAEYDSVLKLVRESAGSYKNLRSYCESAENILVSDAVLVPVLCEQSRFITDKDVEGLYFYSSSSDISFINARK